MAKHLLDTRTGEILSIGYNPERAHRIRLARMRRVVWCAVSALKRWRDEKRCRLIMLTLTYRRVDQWGARQIGQAVRWCRRQGTLGYVWVAELQKRGAVHYHLLVAWPKGKRWRKPDENVGGWSQGYSWVTPNIHRPFYLMKYIQKGSKNGRSRVFPRGLRIYGVSHETVRQFSAVERSNYDECRLPAWFRSRQASVFDSLGCSRVVGGIATLSTFTPSPYLDYDNQAIARGRKVE